MGKNLCKEIKRLAFENIDDVVIHFQIRFFATIVESLTEDTTRLLVIAHLGE